MISIKFRLEAAPFAGLALAMVIVLTLCADCAAAGHGAQPQAATMLALEGPKGFGDFDTDGIDTHVDTDNIDTRKATDDIDTQTATDGLTREGIDGKLETDGIDHGGIDKTHIDQN